MFHLLNSIKFHYITQVQTIQTISMARRHALRQQLVVQVKALHLHQTPQRQDEVGGVVVDGVVGKQSLVP